MRAIRMEVLRGRDVPLVVRSRFEHTFLGLGSFAGLILLLGGGYLMAEALLDPLGASDMGVLTAGFALALSSFLLVYLVWPRSKMALAKRESNHAEEEKWMVCGENVQNPMPANRTLSERKNLPGPM
jgi:hypothetical protein